MYLCLLLLEKMYLNAYSKFNFSVILKYWNTYVFGVRIKSILKSCLSIDRTKIVIFACRAIFFFFFLDSSHRWRFYLAFRSYIIQSIHKQTRNNVELISFFDSASVAKNLFCIICFYEGFIPTGRHFLKDFGENFF